jgi:uncharacterized protein (TIGR03437 family)
MRPHKRLINRITITALAVLLLTAFIVASRLTDRNGVAGNNVVAAQSTVVAVNAVTYTAPLGLGSFAAAFGNNLAVRTEVGPTNPPLTQIAGTTLRLISGGVDVAAPLQFVSAQQINFFVPSNIPLGTAQMVVTNANGVTSTGTVQIVRAAPAIYPGPSGLPYGFTVDLNSSSYGQLTNPDGTQKPIMPGTPWRRLLLGMFGSGFRNASSVSVRFGSIEVPAVFFGPTSSPFYDQVNVLFPTTLPPGPTTVTVIADGQVSNSFQILIAGQFPGAPNFLSINDVNTIISQAVARAKQLGVAATIAVVDVEGNLLGAFRMNGASPTVRITAAKPPDPQGLQDAVVDSMFAAVSKAGTAAFFSQEGSSITTRTASFIIQEHFAVSIPNTESGPLFGVQFSQLPCSDIRPMNGTLPLGLSGDPGAFAIYRNGFALAGVGVEVDGIYTVDTNPSDMDQPAEEIIARAAAFNFDTPQFLRIDNIRVNGILLPFGNVPQTGGPSPQFTAQDGMILSPIRAMPPSRYIPITFAGVPAEIDPRFFPPRDSTVPGPNQLTAGDVTNILANAITRAYRVRAAILIGSPVPAQVNFTVVDTNGAVLGIIRQPGAPEFGFDVSAQKARTASFFSTTTAGQQLLAVEGGKVANFINAAAADGVQFNGQFMWSSRGLGLIARPFFPDGRDGTQNGSLSKPIGVFSPFNNGLQVTLAQTAIVNGLSGIPSPCTQIPSLPNGIQIFPGSGVLFKNGQLVGAIGISGDGVDQDDIISAYGSFGFDPPLNITVDNLRTRNLLLQYRKYPPFPNF